MWVGKKTFLFFIHCDGAIVDILKDYSPKIFANVFTGKMISFFFLFQQKNENRIPVYGKMKHKPSPKKYFVKSNKVNSLIFSLEEPLLP